MHFLHPSSTHHIVLLVAPFGSTEGHSDTPGGVRFRSTGLGICQGRWFVRDRRSHHSEGKN